MHVEEAPRPCGVAATLIYDSQDFRKLKARGYKPAWYPDALHTESAAALWLAADGSLARWQQVRVECTLARAVLTRRGVLASGVPLAM